MRRSSWTIAHMARREALSERETLDSLDRLIAESPAERVPTLALALSARLAALSARVLMLPALNGETGPDCPDANLDVKEAARRLGVSTDWLYRHADRLPFALRIGRRRLFSAHGLERWNRQRRGAR